MNFKSKLLTFFSLLLLLIPINVFAYSDYIILGGDNVGIEVSAKHVSVVGFYQVDNKYIAKDAGIRIGDKILKIGDVEVHSIGEMANAINKSVSNDIVKLLVLRNNIESDISLKLVKDSNNVYKTGIYVKDQVTGIGTLTYIDPGSNIFGALGHEILDGSTNEKLEIRSGKIFKSSITGATKSTTSITGEKNAIFYSSEIFGKINENTISGIFGIYESKSNETNLIKVGKSEDVELGKATIYTVLNGNKIDNYEINILNINEKMETKNILFEITDKRLIDKTNGVIKGMSGSPIVQNNMIVGAVTHAIVNDSLKGYGIFITTMLEEGEN